MDETTQTGTTTPAVRQVRTFASDVAALTRKGGTKDMKSVPTPIVAKPKPPEPPPAEIIPKAPTTNESKEEVLSRLRARAAQIPQKEVPTPPVSYEPVPHAPTTEESKEAVLKRLHAKVAVPPQPKKEDPPKRVHTYKSDFAEHAAERGASQIEIMAAQADAGPAPVTLAPKKRTNVFAFVAGGILVLAGIGSVYAAYRFAVGEPPLPEETFVPSLIFADERIRLSGSGEDLRGNLTSGGGLSLEDKGVAVAYLSYSTTTKEGVTEIVATGNELFAALRLPAPPVLSRSVGPESTIGLVQVEGETRPFFILRVDSYERSFAGMLEWEATMERDLSSFYPPFPREESASSTPAASFRLSFVDEVIGNRDVRVLRDGEGQVLMLYGYRDKNTLIIARNGSAFLELISRLSARGE
jgi:hypothetical protein